MSFIKTSCGASAVVYRCVLSLVSLLLPLQAAAESVAVAPAVYKGDRKPAQMTERGERITEEVVRTIEGLGLSVVTGPDVAQENRAFSPLGDGVCRSTECTEKVAERVEADLAVSVSIVDNGGRVDLEIYTAYADPVVVSTFDMFSSLLRRISENVEASVKQGLKYVRSARESAENAEQVEMQDDGYREPLDLSGQVMDQELLGGGERSRSRRSKRDDGPRKKPIRKAGFWSAFGVTLALGAGYGAVEGIGYSKWQSDTAPPEDERSSVETLQLTSRILLGATAAGAITTAVLAVFTDFKGKSKKRDRTSVEEDEEQKDFDEDRFFSGEGGDDDDDEAEEEEDDRRRRRRIDRDDDEDKDEEEEDDRRKRKKDDDDGDKLFFNDASDLFSGVDLRFAPVVITNGGGVMIRGEF